MLDQHVWSFLGSIVVEKGLSQNTVVAYRTDLLQLCEFLGAGNHDKWGNVTREDLIGFLDACLCKGQPQERW